jgi:hypothetical protein
VKWIKTGWGQEFNSNFDSEKNFHVDMREINPTTSDLLDISYRVISEIIENYPPPYNLFVSGGVDSQTMLWCWLNSGKDFNVYCARLVDSKGNIYNEHDYSTLKLFAQSYDIKINYLDFDIFVFLENHLTQYAQRYMCTSPQITTHMAISELVVTGTNLFSGNFQPGGLYNYTVWGLYRYSLIKNNFIPFFLMHDAELAGALVQYDTDKSFYSSYNYDRKIKLLKLAGVPIIPQSVKYTGFEKIKDYCDINYTVPFNDRIRYAQQPSKRNFDILFRYRLQSIVKYRDKVIYYF